MFDCSQEDYSSALETWSTWFNTKYWSRGLLDILIYGPVFSKDQRCSIKVMNRRREAGKGDEKIQREVVIWSSLYSLGNRFNNLWSTNIEWLHKKMPITWWNLSWKSAFKSQSFHIYVEDKSLWSTNPNGGGLVRVWECTVRWRLLTNLLATLLSSVVHDDRWVDERAGSGHILSQQAFHFVRTQTDGQIEELHWSSLGITGKSTTMTRVSIISQLHLTHIWQKKWLPPLFKGKKWLSFDV